MFTFTEGIPIILGMIIRFPQEKLAKELAALAINLSYNPRNAELMVQGLSRLMLRLQETNDPFLMKIIRNLSLYTCTVQTATPNGPSEYGNLRGVWSPHVKVLMKLAKSTDDQDLLVEILGTLGTSTTAAQDCTVNCCGLSVAYLSSPFACTWCCSCSEPHRGGPHDTELAASVTRMRVCSQHLSVVGAWALRERRRVGSGHVHGAGGERQNVLDVLRVFESDCACRANLARQIV